jgi:hypothetical protein
VPTQGTYTKFILAKLLLLKTCAILLQNNVILLALTALAALAPLAVLAALAPLAALAAFGCLSCLGCLGCLGRCDTNRNDPISLELPKMAKASMGGTTVPRNHKCFFPKKTLLM